MEPSARTFVDIFRARSSRTHRQIVCILHLCNLSRVAIVPKNRELPEFIRLSQRKASVALIADGR